MIRPFVLPRLHTVMSQLGLVGTGCALLIGFCVATLPGCGASKSPAGEAPVAVKQAQPVRVATVLSQPTPLALRAIGTVEAFAAVTVKPQVDGRLTSADFTDGQTVKAGDVLFEIDARPSQAKLQLARANLARDTALSLDARREARRVAELFAKGSAADRERDQAQADADAKAAQVEADEAMVEQAELELEYCTIRSPLNGRVGARLADPGDVVKVNDTPLVVVNQTHPIYVTFSVAERHLAEIRKYNAAGPLAVEARFPQGDKTVERGVLTFTDNQVDRNTGMIRLKGTVENEDDRMWPGQYVDVSLILTVRPNATVVETKAVQAGPDGQFVFVVGADKTVEMRSVRIAEALNAHSVVESGLKPGEQVVTDGQLRLVPGAEVTIMKSQPDGVSQSGATDATPATAEATP